MSRPTWLERAPEWLLEPPTWALGVVLALLGWGVGISPPTVGVDASWNAGLAIATHEGMQYGTEIVFSYGPLGFLQAPFLWYGGFAVLGFLFTAGVYVGFCVALIWALRRRLPGLACLLVGFIALGLLPNVEFPLLLAVLVSLALLERRRPDWVLNAFAVLAASYAAIEVLGKLSTGPVVFVLLLLALVGARPKWWQLAAFLAIWAAEVVLFWLAAGQSLDAVGPFLENTWQIISGYSTAMLRQVDVPAWKVTLATLAAAAITLGTIAVTSRAAFADRRARWAGLALVAIAALTLFKEGVVRTDAGHLSLYFSSACILWIALPWTRARWLLAGAAAIALIGIPVRPPGLPTNFDPVANVRFAADQFHTLLSGTRRDDKITAGRAGMKSVYRLEPRTRVALAGRTVAIEPWEVGVAWAYDLDWDPLPVFQNYSAYTSELDELNAAAVEDPGGPERILRENQLLVAPEFDTPDLDGRYLGWDPPAQARAVLCNFAPLHTTERWQVLGRVPGRCSAPRPIGSASAGYGETVDVPAPEPGEVVFVRIHGAGVSGLERLATTLLHARVRQIVVNGSATYRLIPETAGDGLMLRADPAVIAAEGPVFAPVPQAETIELKGASGDLEFDFYAIRVAPPG
jgi:hypothetical protein